MSPTTRCARCRLHPSAERFGKYRTTLKPGLHFLVPFADRPRSVSWRYKTVRPGATQETLVNHSTNRIDLREHVLDFGRQSVITKDTVSIDIDALLYFQIADPELVAFRIQNMPDALELLTKSSLRNAIASMNLDDTFSSREEINDVLLQKTYRDAERWGVSVRRVEVSDIIPPNDIKRAMEKQIREERYRRSLILSADGERESAVVRSRGHAAQMILRAEGERKSNIQLAKGDAEAKLLMARADAESITSVRNALANPNVDAAAFLVAVQYLRSLRRSASSFKSASVILLPVESVDQISDMVMKQANTRP